MVTLSMSPDSTLLTSSVKLTLVGPVNELKSTMESTRMTTTPSKDQRSIFEDLLI